MTRIQVTRFECFHISRKSRPHRQCLFFLDLARDGNRASKQARLELSRLLNEEKKKDLKPPWWRYHGNVEGRGWEWRVDYSILMKIIDRIHLPCTVQEEINRYKAASALLSALSPHVGSLDFSVNWQTCEVDESRITLEIDDPRFNKHQLAQWREDHPELEWTWQLKRSILDRYHHLFTFDHPYQKMIKDAIKETYARVQWFKEKRGPWQEEHSQYQYHEYRSEARSEAFPSSQQKLRDALLTFGLTLQTATRDAIKSRYRALAMKHHPDHGGESANFRRIQAAYETLCAVI